MQIFSSNLRATICCLGECHPPPPPPYPRPSFLTPCSVCLCLSALRCIVHPQPPLFAGEEVQADGGPHRPCLLVCPGAQSAGVLSIYLYVCVSMCMSVPHMFWCCLDLPQLPGAHPSRGGPRVIQSLPGPHGEGMPVCLCLSV